MVQVEVLAHAKVWGPQAVRAFVKEAKIQV